MGQEESEFIAVSGDAGLLNISDSTASHFQLLKGAESLYSFVFASL